MIKSDEGIDKALEEITTNLVKWRMLKRKEACFFVTLLLVFLVLLSPLL